MKKKDGLYYLSMDAAAKAQNIPKHQLSVAKKLGATGFYRSGRIEWAEFEPWWEKNCDKVINHEDDNLTIWRTRKTKAEALSAEIDLEELRNNSLSKEEVKEFLKQISSAQKALLKSRLCNELPPKILGLNTTEISVIMSNTVEDICNIFQSEMSKWK